MKRKIVRRSKAKRYRVYRGDKTPREGYKCYHDVTTVKAAQTKVRNLNRCTRKKPWVYTKKY